MACEDQINTEDLINAKTDAITLGEVATSRAGAELNGAPITTSTNRFGEVTDTVQGRLNKMGIIFDDPIRDWSASLLVSDLRAHRFPATTGDVYVPTKLLPFTTGVTFNTDDWALYQGLDVDELNQNLISDLSQAYEFNSISDVIAFSGLVVGKICHTIEYSLGVGGGTYKVVPAGTGVETSANYISTNNGLQLLKIANSSHNEFDSFTGMLSSLFVSSGEKCTIGGYNINSEGGASEFEVVNTTDPIGILSDSGEVKFKRLSGHDYMSQLVSDGSPKVSAHRGWHGTSEGVIPGALPGPVYFVPENTSQSTAFAASKGAWSIEGDTKVTSDGKLVVFHDSTVDRTTTSTGNVNTFTLSQLKAMDAGSYVSERYQDTRIQDYEEWFKSCKINRINPFPEVSVVGLTDLQADDFVESMTKYFGKKCKGVIISSTQISALQKFRSRNAYVGLVLTPTFGIAPTTQDMDDAYKLGNSGIMLTGFVIFSTPSIVDDIRDRDLALAYAISNNSDFFEQACTVGCDIIVTDFIQKG